MDQYIKTNYHCHTIFCDGQNTPEEMIVEAINKQIKVLGFSAHVMYPYESSWHLKVKDYNKYVKTIRELQKKYQNQIKILCGVEADYVPNKAYPTKEVYKEYDLDYMIGSVHYVCFEDNAQFTVDGSVEELQKAIDYYNGNCKLLIQTYFDWQRQMAKACDCQIIGHPDLIRKRNVILHFFDENDQWYKNELKATAEAFALSGKIVEINTGAMARGAMKDVYPSEEFLTFLQKKDVPIMINSDAHSCKDLDFAFDFALSKAKKVGFTKLSVL